MSRIIGIDPGYGRLGIAVIDTDGQKAKLVKSDCLITSGKLDFGSRLRELGENFEKYLKLYQPQILAIEKLFVTKNQKTASQVASAKGVIEYLAAKENLVIYEYSPVEIKANITGYGASNKEQVIKMVDKLIELPVRKRLDDEYDAIAIALTCQARERLDKLV